MKILYLFMLTLLFIPYTVDSQVDTQTSFNFIDNPSVARVAGLGGVVNSIKDKDLGLAYGNPALLNPTMHNQAIFSFTSFLAGADYGFFSYARDYKDIGTFSASVLYMNYGKFDETDEIGQVIGQFKANETALNLAGSRMIGERLSAGAQMKFLFSNLEQYNAFGMGLDLGLTYHIEEEFLTTSLVFKNIGYQFTSYYDEADKQNLPFNIQLGLTKRMKHAPFRLGIIMDNLQKWDLTYTDPNLIGKKDPLTGEPIEIKESSFGDKLMRHLLFSAEILLGDAVQFQLAYNHRRRQEMKVTERPGMSGLSFGLGVEIKSFNFNYALSNFTQAGSTHSFTLALRFSDMRKEKALN